MAKKQTTRKRAPRRPPRRSNDRNVHRHKGRFVSPPPSDGPEFPAVKSQPGELCWLTVDGIHIDESYQRPPKPLLHRIALQWNWDTVAPLHIAERDGLYYAWDGQNTLLAARMRQDIVELPCYIQHGKNDIEREAANFVQSNQDRTPVTPLERMKAGLVAGTERYMYLDHVFTKHNFVAAFSGTARHLSCIGAFDWCMKQFAEETIIDQTLQVMDQAYDGETRICKSQPVRGIASFLNRAMREYGERYDLDKIIGRLERRGLDAVLTKVTRVNGVSARHMDKTTGFAAALASVHDQGLRDRRLSKSFLDEM